ncbi:MAG TPA: ABC transporter ATP-binding protein [Candidatus Saccharimonadales bacterium]|nr:ABC transporter ATP-binding protein [Candidatus Saccharimonadales bacterium]
MVDSPALRVTGLTRSFGGLPALAGVDLDLRRGEVVGLLGPNGSGKTTLINVISGVYQPTAGQVEVMGQNATGAAPERMVRLGLNRTFQTPRPFRALTVRENVAVALRHGRDPGQNGDQILELCGLGDKRDLPAESLNSSQQKRLDLARALATAPEVLLVDELAAGMRHDELDGAAELLRQLAAAGRALLVVEHLMGFVRQVTDRVVVLNAGATIFAGSLEEASQEPHVVEVFLGA